MLQSVSIEHHQTVTDFLCQISPDTHDLKFDTKTTKTDTIDTVEGQEVARSKTKVEWEAWEETYLEDSVGRIKFQSIYRRLTRHTKSGIRNKIKDMGLTVKGKREGVTAPQIQSRCGIPKSTLIRHVKQGKLKIIRVAPDSAFEIGFQELRDYVFKYQTYRTMTCFDCDREVKGDIWCSHHIDPDEAPRKKEKEEWKIWTHSTKVNQNLGKVLEEARTQANISKEELSRHLAMSPGYLHSLEQGDFKRIYLDKFVEIATALGLTVEIKVTQTLPPKVKSKCDRGDK